MPSYALCHWNWIGKRNLGIVNSEDPSISKVGETMDMLGIWVNQWNALGGINGRGQ